MEAVCGTVHAQTAGDVMSRPRVVIPRQVPVREAVRLVHRSHAVEAPVVDEQGRFVGILTPADVLRWIDAGCPEAAVGSVRPCSYQVEGCLLTGDEAVICVLAHGGCRFQAEVPTVGGAHTDLCTWKETDPPPAGEVVRYLTTDVVTARPHTPLPELVRRMVEASTDRLVVLDEGDRPVGIVSATGVLNAVAHSGGPGRNVP